MRVRVGGGWGFAATRDVTRAGAQAALARALAVAESQPATAATPLAPVTPALGHWASPYELDPFAVTLEDKLELLFAAERGAAHRRRAPGAHGRHQPRVARAQGLRLDRGRGLHAGDGGRRRGHRRLRHRRQRPAGALLPDRPRRRPERRRRLGARPRPRPRRPRAARGRGGDRAAQRAAVPRGHEHDRPARRAGRRSRSTSRSGTRSSSTASCSARPPTRARAGSAPGDLGSLRYGSELLHVTADATLPGGLGSFGWDDEGVAAVRADLVEGGVLRGALSNRESAAAVGLSASGGCARADGFARQPIVRMTNVSLEPGTRAHARRPRRRHRRGPLPGEQPLVVDRRPPPAVPVRHRAVPRDPRRRARAACTATAPTPASRRASGAASTRSAGPTSGGCGG